jgi:cellulose 1,4-beta-cellobiosidase
MPAGVTSPTKGPTSITLAWAASTDNVAVTAYKVYRGGSLITTVNSPALTFTDSGLTAATNYNYQVSAVDAAGNESAKTAALSITTSIGTPAPDTTAPSVPVGVTSTSKSATNISFTWTASKDDVAVTGYKLYRNNSLFQTVTSATLNYNDTSVLASTTYSYQVTAFDTAGNESAKSTALSVTTNASATPIGGDIDGSGHVNYVDLGILLSNYNKSSTQGDLNGDGRINYVDLGILLGNYGK